MLTPMRSFTLASGFWLSSLATTSAAAPFGHAVQPHQRRVANQFRYIVGDFHSVLRFLSCVDSLDGSLARIAYP